MEQKFIPPANPRFTDYPFRKPGRAVAQLDLIEKRRRAVRIFRDTGDPSIAEEIGLFWNEADEERAREAQRLRFSNDPSRKLTDEEMAARYAPILEKRRKDSIKGMVGLFKPIQEPYPVFRPMRGPLLTDAGIEARVGDELWSDGFLSMSRSPHFAAQCGVHEFTEGFVFIEVHPAENAETITLDNEVSDRMEYESIFNFGQKLRIDKAIPNFESGPHPFDKIGSFYVGTLFPA